MTDHGLRETLEQVAAEAFRQIEGDPEWANTTASERGWFMVAALMPVISVALLCERCNMNPRRVCLGCATYAEDLQRPTMQMQRDILEYRQRALHAESALAKKDAHLVQAQAQVDVRLRERAELVDKVAEQDAQIAALQAELARLRSLLNYALNGWGAHAKKDMEHDEIGRLRREALRSSPAAPAQETQEQTLTYGRH